MADIRDKILQKYDIDISTENLFKLYKIETADISEAELDEKINAASKRWNQSINGANEKNAERDKARLEKAEKYTAILKDSKLRKQLYNYYNNSNSADGKTSSENTEFAREYFKTIETSKKLRNTDVEFFFNYYQSQRKNKKAILEMLKNEFKVIGLGSEEKYEENQGELKDKYEKKSQDSSRIVNLFQEATIIKLHKCIELAEKIKTSAEISAKYPAVANGLYDFLELKKFNTADELKQNISARGKEAYSIRQEKGTEFIPLVDLFNTFQEVVQHQDVIDNIEEFKLLVKYPEFTPYMYSFVEMKPSTLKKITKVAETEYSFRNETEFILNYYKLVHDNFGISDSSIRSIIKKAEKKAAANKILNAVDEKIGRRRKDRIPFGASLIYFMMYWPIFLLYLIFEIFKLIFTNIDKFVIPVFLTFFLGLNYFVPKSSMDFPNMYYLRNIFVNNDEWKKFIENEITDSPLRDNAQYVIYSLIVILGMLIIYIAPSVFGAYFIKSTSELLNKNFDWIGYKRTFKSAFANMKQNAFKKYSTSKKIFYKKSLPGMFVNLICTALIVSGIIFIPPKIADILKPFDNYKVKENIPVEAPVTKATEPEIQFFDMIITTDDEPNIRSGPGVENDILETASYGDIYKGTGNTAEASNGRIWYEVCLKSDKTQKGWASEAIIEYVQ